MQPANCRAQKNKRQKMPTAQVRGGEPSAEASPRRKRIRAMPRTRYQAEPKDPLVQPFDVAEAEQTKPLKPTLAFTSVIHPKQLTDEVFDNFFGKFSEHGGRNLQLFCTQFWKFAANFDQHL